MELAPEGVEIVAIVRPGNTPPPAKEGVEWLECDLAERGFERGLPPQMDAVVHLAQSSRDRDFPEGTEDVLDLAVGATARLLDYARLVGASRFVLASTASLYAGSSAPLTEEAELDCSGFYAAAKRSAELLVNSYGELLSGLALRIFTPYGPGQRVRLIPDLVRRVREGEPVKLEGDRGLLLSPIYVDDLALVAHGLLGGGVGDPGFELVNVAGEQALGIREIAEEIGRALGTEPVFDPTGEGEPKGLIADCSKLRRLLPDFQPTPFERGVRNVIGAGSGSG